MNSKKGDMDVFLAYYLRTDSIAHSSSIAYSFVGGLSISIAFLSAPLTTIVLRYMGVKVMVLTGALFQAAAFIGASFASQMWHLLLSQGTTGIISQWFKKRRSLANAIGTCGSGFGGMTYVLATETMIKHIGIGWTFRTLGIIAFVVNGTCGFLLRDRNTAVGAVLNPFNRAVLKKVEYWIFCAWAFFSVMGYVILVFSIVDYAQDAGFSANQASLAAALLNMAQGFARLALGYVSDIFGRMNTAAFVTLWCRLIVYCIIGCGLSGAVFATIAPIAAEVVGISLLQPALSFTWLFLVLPSTFAETIALSLRKNSSGNRYINV
ncbi:major facilitator superfamily domain-containing protein [Xylogone sp. PMI_703]|nr:major facilitator superfamily domain-containing protein [Xylogone sp. PMI_703]